MNPIEAERAAAVAECASHIRHLEASYGVTRDGLEHIGNEVVALGKQAHLFPFEDFPLPDDGRKNKLYRLAMTDDERQAIYLNVSAGHVKSPPHNHTTWAVVAGVRGSEMNYFYDRVDDGSTEGKAEIRENGELDVRPGYAIRLLPDDIHAIELSGDEPKMHLHCYGLALHRLDARLAFDMKAGTCKVMSVPDSAR